MKKYLVWLVIPVVVIILFLYNVYSQIGFRNDESFGILGFYLIIGFSLLYALLGTIYYLLEKRKERLASKAIDLFVDIILFFTVLFPFFMPIAASFLDTIIPEFSMRHPLHNVHSALFRCFAFVQIIAICLLVFTYIQKQNQDNLEGEN